MWFGESFRLSGGKGTVKVLETLEDYTDLDNVDYNVFYNWNSFMIW